MAAMMMMFGGMAFAQEPEKQDIPEKTEQPASNPDEAGKKDEGAKTEKPDTESKSCDEASGAGCTK